MKECQECGIITDKKYKKYCHETQRRNCVICQNEFLFECNSVKRKTCSISCSRKLTRLNTGRKNILQCIKCKNQFNGQSANSKYCNRIIEQKCSGCNILFNRKCNNDYGSYCSTSCRNSFMRKTKYAIKEHKKCISCHQTFTPETSGQVFCKDLHYRKCGFCNEDYILKNNMNKFKKSNFCSNTCATFAQTNSTFDKQLLRAYRNINQWAIDFKNNEKRKPKLADFVIYFGINRIPKHADKSLFSRVRDSKLELTVLYYLKNAFPNLNIVRWKREKINDKHLEIDLFLPDCMIGFEIQDFRTHCREESDELSSFGEPMKDKRYHESKRSAYLSIGIKIVELWEDEILDGSFKSKLLSHLDQE